MLESRRLAYGSSRVSFGDAWGDLIEFVLLIVIEPFLGMTPERPLWLRRLVQAFWVLLGLLVVIAWVYAIVLFVRTI